MRFLGQCWPTKRPPSPTSFDFEDAHSPETTLNTTKDDPPHKDRSSVINSSINQPPSSSSPEPDIEDSPGSRSEGPASTNSNSRHSKGTPTKPDFHLNGANNQPQQQQQQQQQYPYFVVSDVGLEAAVTPFSWQSLSEKDSKYEASDAGTYAIAGIQSGQEAVIQDRTVIALNLGPPSQSGSSAEAGLFALFDGHGPNGQAVSEQLANNVVSIFRRRLLQERPANVLPCVRDAFREMENSVLKPREWVESGASGTVAVSTMGHLIVAGVGDTTAVLGSCCDGQWRTIDMTVDHIPDVDLEVSRIRSNGGVIRRPDYSNGDDYRPMRVYQQNSDMPGLKTTRCLGNAAAKRIGVAWDPQFFTRRLEEEDKFLVICSAEVWRHISREEAIQMVRGHESAEEASWELASEARRRGHLQSLLRHHTAVHVDDVSALVIFFTKAGESGPHSRGPSGRNEFKSTAVPAAIDIPSDVISKKFKIWVEAEQARVVASQRTKEELRQMLVEDDAPSRPLHSPGRNTSRTSRPQPSLSAPTSPEDFGFLQEQGEEEPPPEEDTIYAF
mmetsp:Transcript_42110/g.98766  ORF Transcript_42110/g.98766 Transcript_42110/m.98766 type:complete len:557 (+) Transcript_42110:254-1924(+)